MQVGNITALNYSNAYSIFNVTRNDYTTGTTTNDQNLVSAMFSTNQSKYGPGSFSTGRLNLALTILSNSRTFYNQSSNDQWVDRTGTGISDGQLNGAFDKVYRGIYSGQLMGIHDLFNDKTKVEWVAGYNNLEQGSAGLSPVQNELRSCSGSSLYPDPQHC